MTTSDTPTISVIICTYNRHELLRRALDSVLMQDMTDFEVIIVDDGSDDPVDLPIAYLDRVRMIRTEHRGVGAARSEGLQAACGTFVAYCDDDDEWKPHHLGCVRTRYAEAERSICGRAWPRGLELSRHQFTHQRLKPGTVRPSLLG